MRLRIWALGYFSLLLIVAACSAQPTTLPPAAPPLEPAPTVVTLTTPTTLAVAPARAPLANATATPPRFQSPTPPPNPGTTITAAGPYQNLTHPSFYWTLQLPDDWVITYDRGFEILANNPSQTASLHLLAQVWGLPQGQLATARDYVNYWKHSKYGDLFPLYAVGTQVSEQEIGQGKFGGPYLHYAFDDAKNGVRYLEVYASGGGPSSVVLSTWAKSGDFGNVQPVLEGILNSLELLPQH